MRVSASIAELCDVQSGGTPSRTQNSYWGGSIPWVKISEMREGRVRHTEEHISEAGLANSSAKIFPKGTVLLSIFATIGRTAVLDIPAATNQAIAGLTIKDAGRLDSVYFRRYLDFISPKLANQGRGVAQANINLSILKRTEVPLPLLAEQRRIATILDKVDALRAKRREAIAKLDQLLQSIFLNMFGDVSSNDQGWPEVALGDVVESTKLGLVRGASEFGDGPEFDVPYIRMDAIGRGGEFLPKRVRMTKATVQEMEESSVRYGDFLFNTRNSRDLVGKSTIFESKTSLWTFNNNLMRIRFTDRVNSFYMLRYLMSRRGQMELEKRKSGTTSVFAVYYKDLKTLPLVLPPKVLQDKFQRIVEDQRKVRDRVVQQEVHVQSLMQTLQHAAFSGRL